MIQSRYRIATGFALIGAGVVVAILGYLGVSKETEVAFQLPYFASAGIGALLLMGFGGTMLLSAQLDRDETRLNEIENAVRALAEEVGRLSDELIEARGETPLRAVGGERPSRRRKS